MQNYKEIQQAKTLSKAAILAKQNVVGVGIGYKQSGREKTGKLSLIVLVRHKIPLAGLSLEDVIPQEIYGARTDVIEVGNLQPLGVNTARWRPAPAGVSLGHYCVTAGTLGYVVRDRLSGQRLILSNNHVLANCNDGRIGDPILQPGAADGGQLDKDSIAHLVRFRPLMYNNEPATCNLAKGYVRVGNAIARLLGSRHQLQAVKSIPGATNLVDAALARPINQEAVLDTALEIGAVTGITPASLGMSVRKSGRTTALTNGEISVLDATVTVNYTLGRVATFENQIVTSPMSLGGDFGSLLVTGDFPPSVSAVGLLFAGSNQVTLHNPIQAVLDELRIEIAPQAAGEAGLKRVNQLPVKSTGPVQSTGSKIADTQTQIEKAQEIKQAYYNWLMSKANVVGVGVGLKHQGGKRTDTVALIVLVRKKVPQHLLPPQDILPADIEGIPLDIKEAGELYPI